MRDYINSRMSLLPTNTVSSVYVNIFIKATYDNLEADKSYPSLPLSCFTTFFFCLLSR